jgi:thymidylate synthase ThyX
MTITAEVIADSYNDHGVRLTTSLLTFPRFILPEFNTHRAVSKNASSSRAIPLAKQIERLLSDTVFFLNPGYNKSGMQAAEPLSPEDEARVADAWLDARDAAIAAAKVFEEVGLHKQHANRVLEPWMHQTIIASATDLENFFHQRISDLAQPEINELAIVWKRALDESHSSHVPMGGFHLPFVTDEEKQEYRDSVLVKFSVARCARTSYLTPQGDYDPEKDLSLYDRLTTAQPPHFSPAEHVATPAHLAHVRGGNLRGWIQHRQFLETQLNYDSTR